MKPRWTKEQLIDGVKEGISYSDVLKRLNIRVAGGNWKTIKKYIILYNIDTSHFLPYSNSQHPNKIDIRYTEQEIFCENSIVNKGSLRRLYKTKVPYICTICGNTGAHLGNPLSLQIDHINGTSNDNRLENLRLLCPNCHSQTDSFAGRNNKLRFCKTCGVTTNKRSGYCTKKCRPILTTKLKKIGDYKRKIVKWPSAEIIKARVLEVGYKKSGIELGVSGNSVKKYLKRNGIMLPRYYTQNNLY